MDNGVVTSAQIIKAGMLGDDGTFIGKYGNHFVTWRKQ
jgi:hypothetical protein